MTKKQKLLMNLSGVNSEVYNYLVTKGPASAAGVQESIGRPVQSIRRSLLALARLGLVESTAHDAIDGNIWDVKA